MIGFIRTIRFWEETCSEATSLIEIINVNKEDCEITLRTKQTGELCTIRFFYKPNGAFIKCQMETPQGKEAGSCSN